MASIFDPKGKNFSQRINAFLDDAKATYGITVGKDSGRQLIGSKSRYIR